jgi:hypothetical protein
MWTENSQSPADRACGRDISGFVGVHSPRRTCHGTRASRGAPCGDFESADGRLDVLAQEWPKRLKLLREKHPVEDIDDAAYNCGRLLQTILKHEREEIPQNIDFQIGYALALRARPEFAVLTVLPLHPRPHEQVDWWEPLPASSMRLLGKDIGKEWMRKLANAFEGIY